MKKLFAIFSIALFLSPVFAVEEAGALVTAFEEYRPSIESTVKSNLDTLKYGLPISIVVELTDAETYELFINPAGDVSLLPDDDAVGDIHITTSNGFINQVLEAEDPKALISNNENFAFEGKSLKGKVIKEFVEKQFDVHFYEPPEETGIWARVIDVVTGFVSEIFIRFSNLFG